MPHYDSLEQEAFLNLWRTYDRLKALEDALFSQHGLSAQQYNALRLLRSVYPGSMLVSQLGRRLISRAPDMTRLLDRLEQRGLVRRDRTGDDRRAVQLTITAAGLRLLEKIRAPLAECHHRQLGHMSQTALRRLIGYLRQARAPHEPEDILQASKGKATGAGGTVRPGRKHPASSRVSSPASPVAPAPSHVKGP